MGQPGGTGCPRNRWLVQADVGDLGFGDPHEILGRDAHRALMRACLEHDRLELGQTAIDDDAIAPASADRWHRSQVELGVISRQVLLGRQMDLLPAASGDLAQLVEVDPLQAGSTART